MTRQIAIERHFDSWREASRKLLAQRVPPQQVLWTDRDELTLMPAQADPEPSGALSRDGNRVKVPAQFLSICTLAACHRDPQRWSVMYRVLWRLTHGEGNLLHRITDPDMHELLVMEKAVRRDRHKMTAFVRFRRVIIEQEEHFIAWHRPEHFIVKLTAPFFRDRFASMRWSILTPDDCVHWDGHTLCFSPGVSASAAPEGDALEELWKTYYASVFNPARVNLRAMSGHMPRRHWPTLPEAQLIDELVRTAPQRVEAMVKSKAATTTTADGRACDFTGSARDFLPGKITLPQLNKAVQGCRGCGIYCNATQAVFGEGPASASVMFVGEQPGDQEDLEGKPFVGPAGGVLDRGLEEAGIDRGDVYVTNAVKHFKWEPRGKRRIHAKPSSREIDACLPWLKAEIAVVQPKLLVCLGATAAQALLGRSFRVTQRRGEVLHDSTWAPAVVATVHPSSILRSPDDDSRRLAYQQFVNDLKAVQREMSRITRQQAAENARRQVSELHPGRDARVFDKGPPAAAR